MYELIDSVLVQQKTLQHSPAHIYTRFQTHTQRNAQSLWPLSASFSYLRKNTRQWVCCNAKSWRLKKQPQKISDSDAVGWKQIASGDLATRRTRNKHATLSRWTRTVNHTVADACFTWYHLSAYRNSSTTLDAFRINMSEWGDGMQKYKKVCKGLSLWSRSTN